MHAGKPIIESLSSQPKILVNENGTVRILHPDPKVRLRQRIEHCQNCEQRIYGRVTVEDLWEGSTIVGIGCQAIAELRRRCE